MIQQTHFWDLKKIKLLSLRDICTSMFTSTLFTIAKTWKQFKCSLRWMDKENVVYIPWDIVRLKKEGNSAICNNIDGPWGHYAKQNQSDRKKQYCVTSVICGT